MKRSITPFDQIDVASGRMEGLRLGYEAMDDGGMGGVGWWHGDGGGVHGGMGTWGSAKWKVQTMMI